MNLALALGFLVVGASLVYSGFSGKTIKETLAAINKNRPSITKPTKTTLLNSNSPGVSTHPPELGTVASTRPDNIPRPR